MKRQADGSVIIEGIKIEYLGLMLFITTLLIVAL